MRVKIILRLLLLSSLLSEIQQYYLNQTLGPKFHALC